MTNDSSASVKAKEFSNACKETEIVNTQFVKICRLKLLENKCQQNQSFTNAHLANKKSCPT
jgi:hypothetical protein